MSKKEKYKLELPENKGHLLLHSCCAPCSGEIIQRLLDSKIKFSVFFYNPNIHPLKEYEIRKNENKKFSEKNNIPFIDADYDATNWFKETKGMEWEPERGERCSACFGIRFLKTAEYAHKNSFDIFSSTLGISRWKDIDQINQAGEWAAKKVPDLKYWTFNWRKDNGSQRMLTISKNENFYKQEYCGCTYSLRDTNIWRSKNSRNQITIGQNFYTHSIKKSSKN